MEEKQDRRGDYAFTGFMFIGMGLGYYMNNLLIGMFIGMGIGFFAKIFFPDNK